jgi:hypothetical protein
MELKGLSRGFDGGVTTTCTSIKSVHAESVLTRKASTPSRTLLFIWLISEYRDGRVTTVAMIANREHTEAIPRTM